MLIQKQIKQTITQNKRTIRQLECRNNTAIYFRTPSNFQLQFQSLLIFVAATLLYHSIFLNIFRKVIQQVFFSADDFSSVYKTYIYVILVNFPFVLIIFISLFSNNSVLGLEIALTVDEISIYLVAGYICWIQESRHTPIRGIHLIRDIIFAVLSMALVFDCQLQGNIALDISSPLLAVFLVYHIILSNFEVIQDLLLRGFGLKQSNRYNSKYLLTSKHQIQDFLQIKDIISEKKKDIQEQLQDFREILYNLQNNEQDQQILMNFAKLYLPIKKATELKDKIDNADILNQICQQWDEISQQSDSQSQEDQQLSKNLSRNDSGDHIAFNKDTYTYNEDFVVQSQKKQPQMNKYQTFLKYLFYPIYLAKKAQGRLRYFVYLFSTGGIVLLMYLISNTSNYYQTQIKSTVIVSIIVALSLAYPSAAYFIQISAKSDYDFTNIFILSIILKVMFFSLGALIYSLFISEQINFRIGTVSALFARIITLGIFLVFMILKRFATRYDNFKFFVGLISCSFFARALGQGIINSRN